MTSMHGSSRLCPAKLPFCFGCCLLRALRRTALSVHLTPLACEEPLFGVVIAREELDEVDVLVRRVQAMNAVDGLLLRPEITHESDSDDQKEKPH